MSFESHVIMVLSGFAKCKTTGGLKPQVSSLRSESCAGEGLGFRLNRIQNECIAMCVCSFDVA